MECFMLLTICLWNIAYVSPPMNRRKGNPLSTVFIPIPIRSQCNAIKAAGRSLACGGSKEHCVWQKILVKEGGWCLSSVSEALGQICHTFTYTAKLTFFPVYCVYQSAIVCTPSQWCLGYLFIKASHVATAEKANFFFQLDIHFLGETNSWKSEFSLVTCPVPNRTLAFRSCSWGTLK